MSRLESTRHWLSAHPVGAVFLALVAVPATIAVLSFKQVIPLPATVFSALEVVFRLFVYAPVAAVRAVLFEPLGLGVLFSIPGLNQTVVFLTLLGFYYALSVAIVHGSRFARHRLALERRRHT
ncbi:hypothetical protein [Natronorubrum sulfidifaciens]|uniref:Uncharacterized protein n=1 Tax=Natronorubrum sulfidifaciens JCM 14089 TaxID=1230460 RepID=L9W7H3_9EURY|nr:hypothetical protein [Natronorubrum sulfidifaciens]ELY44283.1 hypothetical protein C495_10289 [Natronorubrum sulfidifaciens JCM 14089]